MPIKNKINKTYYLFMKCSLFFFLSGVFSFILTTLAWNNEKIKYIGLAFFALSFLGMFVSISSMIFFLVSKIFRKK